MCQSPKKYTKNVAVLICNKPLRSFLSPQCGVCKGQLGDTTTGTDVRIRNGLLNCHQCYIRSRCESRHPSSSPPSVCLSVCLFSFFFLMSQPLSSLQFVTQTPLARMNSGQFQENQIRGNEFRANSGNVQSNRVACVKEVQGSVAFHPLSS